jgi:hypothetical protein
MVPADAVAGAVRMRAFLKYNSNPTSACENNFSYGEVEDYTVNVSGNVRLSLTAMLEGAFNGTDMRTDLNSILPLSQPFNIPPYNYPGTESVVAIPGSNVVEWILVEVRDASTATTATPATIVGRQAAFLLNDGSIVGLDGTSDLEFPVSISQGLHVVIWHRNHIGILSNNELSPSGGLYTYNFSNGINQVYGGANGHKELAPGVWGMMAGDGNRNGMVDAGDKSSDWESQTGETGYLSSDYNLDAQSDNVDKNNYWVPNLGEDSQVPD